MKKSYIDLHMHSLYSDDGEFTPSQLVDMSKEAGIQIMAIADHNWVKAIDEAKERALEKNVILIPAIEIDCTFKDVNLHVLGYGIDHQASAFNELGENVIASNMNGGNYTFCNCYSYLLIKSFIALCPSKTFLSFNPSSISRFKLIKSF